MLLPFLPRDERERGVMFESIGPVWDGNEVWLVVAGGATFAAFPAWYATMFSGFYLALLLVLFFLIVRVVSFEWREKSDEPALAQRSGSGRTPSAATARRSSGASRLSNLLYGVPLDSNGDFTGTFWDLFSPYTVLAGVAVVLLFAFHGATFLTLRTTGDLCERAAARRARLSIPAVALGAGFLVWTVGVADRPERQGRLPARPPGRARDRRARCSPSLLVRHGRSGWAFAMTALGDRARRSPRSSPACTRASWSPSPNFGNSLTVDERLVGALHARRDERRRADRHARRPALPGLDVPRLPAPARRRGAGGGAGPELRPQPEG